MPKIYVDEQGRITLPRHIRGVLGIKEKTYVDYDIKDRILLLKA